MKATDQTTRQKALAIGGVHIGIRGRLFLGIGGRDHFGIRGRIASEFAHAATKEFFAELVYSEWCNAVPQASIARACCTPWLGHSFSRKSRASCGPQNWRGIPFCSVTHSGMRHGTSPAQLAQLRRVFDDELMRRGWPRRGARTENLASRIFCLYQSGTRSRPSFMRAREIEPQHRMSGASCPARRIGLRFEALQHRTSEPRGPG
ncbi:hypothetical protein AB7M37_005434 [Sinorhizobium fredii]